jgi:hypothetical protein
LLRFPSLAERVREPPSIERDVEAMRFYFSI